MPTPITLEIADRIATIALNRPERLNAIDDEMVTEGLRALERVAGDAEVGAVILTGAGRAFCAGGDIRAMSELGEMTLEQRRERLRRAHEFPFKIATLPKIVIAAVGGPAMGAGLGLALACDAIVASEAASFGAAYAKVGYSGDFGVTRELTRRLGPTRALEMLLLAEPIDAAEALRWGLVNRVVAHEALDSEARGLAARIAGGPLAAYRYMKENVRLAGELDTKAMLDREAETNARCGMTADHREGVAAFLEKRPPRFTGR